MKKYAYIFAAAIAALACTKENPSNPSLDEKPEEPLQGVEMTFGATLEQTKAGISDNKTVWAATDHISVFDGVANCDFKSKGEGESTTFTGTAAVADNYYALYPYQATASCSEGVITATVPSVQTATPGSFDPAAALMVARGSQNFEFKNVCSLIKVTVPADVTGITSIEFSGNADENIAGEVSISFDELGLPTTTGAGVNTITLKAAEGQKTLDAGDYYIAALPNTYSQGLKLLIHYEKGMFQQAKATDALKVERSAVRPVGTVKWPEVVFIGSADVDLTVNAEVNTAVQWMIYNIKNSAYVPLTALNATVLSNCSVVWWHYHRDWSVNSIEDFKSFTGISEDNISVLKTWYDAGGSMFLSRYAVYLSNIMEINNAVPDVHFGGPEKIEEGYNGGWYVTDNQFIFCEGSTRDESPYFKGCATNEATFNEWCVNTFEPSYYFSNSTCHYSATDFGAWQNETGNVVKAKSNGDSQKVVGWECPQSGTQGLVFCLGTPLYDWYTEDGTWLMTKESLHNNVMTITSNTIEYLKTK